MCVTSSRQEKQPGARLTARFAFPSFFPALRVAWHGSDHGVCGPGASALTQPAQGDVSQLFVTCSVQTSFRGALVVSPVPQRGQGACHLATEESPILSS